MYQTHLFLRMCVCVYLTQNKDACGAKTFLHIYSYFFLKNDRESSFMYKHTDVSTRIISLCLENHEESFYKINIFFLIKYIRYDTRFYVYIYFINEMILKMKERSKYMVTL